MNAKVNSIYTHIFLLIAACIFLSACNSDPDHTPESFEIHPDFTLQLVASEPLIKDPVDLEFDEHGHAYVLEMPGYPYEDQESRIVILKDTNQDGIYDSNVIFAEELELASSIMPYQEGILVAAPPYLLFLKDTDGDDRADERYTLMSGFSTGNLQHNYNGLTFGIDNWIYAANGGNSGGPHWYEDSTSILDLRGDDFRFKLENKILERIGASSGGYELAIDEYGRIFETHNLEHISQLVYPSRYAQNLPLSPEHGLRNVSNHEENGLARIYPIGEQESRVNHPEQSGYFSGACGITYYGGGSFGTEFDQTAWVADVVLNLIHVDKLSPFGATFSAGRVMEKQDFLASTDRSFRPVNMTVGPDGAMYIIDMYREVIEHPEWIPDDIESTLDLNAGKEKGRIYKVQRKNATNKTYNISNFESPEGLLQSIQHPNQWVRNTAHRLLLDKNLAKEELGSLTSIANGDNPFGRLHALWLLYSKDFLPAKMIEDRLRDANPDIRENALIIAEATINSDKDVLEVCTNLLSDANQRVRMQAALTLSTISEETFEGHKDLISAAVLSASDEAMDDFNVSALTLAAKFFPGHLFESILKSRNITGKENLLASLARISGLNPEESSKVLATLSMSKEPADLKSNIISSFNSNLDENVKGEILLPFIRNLEEDEDPGLIAALANLRRSLGLPLSPAFVLISKAAVIDVRDKTLSEEIRLKQMSIIQMLPYDSKSELLYTLLSNKESLRIQEETLKQLWEADHPEVGKKLVQKWAELGPRSRQTASDILLYKRSHHDALLTGLEEGMINIGEMNFDLERRRTLLWWTDNENTKKRAQALFSDSGVINRKDAIEKMKPALELAGFPENGSIVFEQLCGQCHIYGTSGTDAGPVLTEINRKSKASLLHDIIDPNAAVDTKYINHKLETEDGTLHIGIVNNETDKSISIKKMGGTSVTVPKERIKSFSSLGTLYDA